MLPDDKLTWDPDQSDEVRATEDPASEGRDRRPEHNLNLVKLKEVIYATCIQLLVE